jgi:hypothetical protein
MFMTMYSFHQHLQNGEKGSRSNQRKKLSYHHGPMTASTNFIGNFGARRVFEDFLDLGRDVSLHLISHWI